MTTTQAVALGRLYSDALGYCSDNSLNTAHRDADYIILKQALTRQTELEKAAEGMSYALMIARRDVKNWIKNDEAAKACFEHMDKYLAAYRKIKGEVG